ncbi:MAG: hypothetical protein LBR81_05510 [Prevotellaceae bacterium]|jgi:hypothetical protein|nr:hypothetical protein [Prevotellaceae bacterium]
MHSHSATLHFAAFLVLRSGLFYLRCFVATPTPTPDHPPLKTVTFFILFAFHAGYEISKLPNVQNGNMAK